MPRPCVVLTMLLEPLPAMTPIALIALLALGVLDQDPPQKPPQSSPPGPPSVSAETPADEPALLAEDGQPVEPGRIPEGTSAAAKMRWEKVMGGTLADALPPIHSFDLRFNVQSRRPGAINDLDVGIAYLEEEHPRAPFLRLFLQREDLVSIHGPDGAWLMDGDEVQRMSGRQYAEDLRQLREYRTLAGNLLALIQPDRVRLVSLRALEVTSTPDEGPWSKKRVSFEGADPLDLPDAETAKEARQYEWVELVSPDLRVHRSDEHTPENTVYRGRLAIEPGSGQVRLVVLHALSPSGRPVPHSALLVDVKQYTELIGGYRLPRDMVVKEIDSTTSPLTFARRDGTSLWLMTDSSSVNPPALTVASFRPQ